MLVDFILPKIFYIFNRFIHNFQILYKITFLHKESWTSRYVSHSVECVVHCIILLVKATISCRNVYVHSSARNVHSPKNPAFVSLSVRNDGMCPHASCDAAAHKWLHSHSQHRAYHTEHARKEAVLELLSIEEWGLKIEIHNRDETYGVNLISWLECVVTAVIQKFWRAIPPLCLKTLDT